ncbi:MAG: response regulator [Cyanobacteriota bacterium]|nr:response regulator [Cyanobacteriota bacterium]
MTSTQNSKGNILVIDDTPANLRLLIGILSENGYNVRAMPNGKLALAGIYLSLPNLILLDINMPELDGYQVCEKLKADERTRDIPVIFISALNEAIDKVKAFQVGGLDYITKPFHVEEVLARIDTHLTLRRLQQGLEEKNTELTKTLQKLENTQDELIHSEKMAALGQLVAGIAHEINTPLGVIGSSIRNISNFLYRDLETFVDFIRELSRDRKQVFFDLLETSAARKNEIALSTREQRKLKRSLSAQLATYAVEKPAITADYLVSLGIYEGFERVLPILQTSEGQTLLNAAYQLGSVRSSAQTISKASSRAAKIVFALKKYARYDLAEEKTRANLIESIETVLTLYQNQLKQGVEVTKNYPDNCPDILCYPDELCQVWVNLIHNALQAMDNQGKLAIGFNCSDSRIEVSITDTGQGIPPEIQNKIFQPFFTTKAPGEGSGLGLDIVKKIVEKHQGEISFETAPGQTTFSVILPLK